MFTRYVNPNEIKLLDHKNKAYVQIYAKISI